MSTKVYVKTFLVFSQEFKIFAILNIFIKKMLRFFLTFSAFNIFYLYLYIYGFEIYILVLGSEIFGCLKFLLITGRHLIPPKILKANEQPNLTISLLINLKQKTFNRKKLKDSFKHFDLIYLFYKTFVKAIQKIINQAQASFNKLRKVP